MSLNFLTHINGLRAVSVLFVIAYHFELGIDSQLRLFGGGLIGVDIFFVISGYIITRQIISQGDKFSIVLFYEKRARRILPALLMMLLISTICAQILLVGRAKHEYFNSLLSVIGFGANIFFWLQDSYTAEANLYRPLLHTWSLGVEEQFYLLYPLAWLLIISKVKYKKITITIGIVLSYGLMVVSMDGHASAGFYLIPTRSWQIMTGILVALLPSKKTKNALIDEVAPISAILTIFLCVFYFNEDMEVKYYLLMLPIFSAGIIIYFNNSIVHSVLNTQILQSIGLLSFSLYLYHQPIIVFKRIIFDEGHDILIMGLAIFVTFLLSALSYKYIENRFRSEKTKFSIMVGFTGIVLITLLSCYIYNTLRNIDVVDKKFKIGEYQEEALKVNGRPCHNRKIEDLCEIKPSGVAYNDIYVVGDSHASVVGVKIAELSILKDNGYVQITAPGCHYAPYVKTRYCTQFNNLTRKKLLSITPQVIVITGRLPLYISGTGYDNGEGGWERKVDDNFLSNVRNDKNNSNNELLNNLSRGIQELVDYGHRVVLIYPVPEPGWNIPTKLAAMSLKDDAKSKENSFLSHSYDRYKARTNLAFKVYNDVTGNLVRIYPANVFCNHDIAGRCITHNGSIVFYRDDNHLSIYGVNFLFSEISEKLF